MLPLASFDEAKFKRSLCYNVTSSAETVLTDMDFLRQFDIEQEKKSRLWLGVGWLGIVGIVIGAACFFGMQSVVLGGAAGVLGLVTAIAGFSVRAIHGRLDLDDRRYEVVAGLLRLLSKDMADDAPVTVALDFQPHNHKKKLQRKGKVGYWNVQFFVDGWLTMQGRFLDGTKYTVTLIEKQQDRHRTKRSASGKTKHKHKTKNSSEAIISLKIKEKRYPQAQELYKTLNETLKLPSWVELKSVVAEGDVLTLRTTSRVTWDAPGPGEKAAARDGINWMAMMFLSLYRFLNNSK
ncbi:MAG: hypothetical protein QGG71_24140 [Pirellulaceae bacterium]|jgi:uncharacterized membrane protein YkgB|nr:hypothetical protein [Planctomycetaceae bacterium]MDP6557779.1 hypothetical protein [Pirellulaceae bacterium]